MILSSNCKTYFYCDGLSYSTVRDEFMYNILAMGYTSYAIRTYFHVYYYIFVLFLENGSNKVQRNNSCIIILKRKKYIIFIITRLYYIRKYQINYSYKKLYMYV